MAYSHIAGVCAVLLFGALYFDERDSGQHGVHQVTLRPTVHRVWNNLESFPVKRGVWEKAGFRVMDTDWEAAKSEVFLAGYGMQWNCTPNRAAKADLWRYVRIFAHGGWYADADVEPRAGLHLLAQQHELVLFHEACGSLRWNKLAFALGVSTVTHSPQWRASMFAAPAQWVGLRRALLLLKTRVQCSEQWSIVAQIDKTGPGLLTDAVNGLLDPAELIACRDQPALFFHAGMGTWK